MRRFVVAEQAKHFVGGVGEVGSGTEDRLHPGVAEHGIILRRDDPAGDDLDVGPAGMLQRTDELGDEGLVARGERRRAEITRALVMSPRFMLLDEPFAGIDPIAVTDIQKIIFHLKERGIGVLVTDHNVRETLRITDRAYIVNEGAVLEEGVPAHIAASRRAREIYLGEKFRL